MSEPKSTAVTTIKQLDTPYLLETVVDDVCSPQLCLKNASALDFPYFPKLPYELRREIWLSAHPEPRDVVLDIHPPPHKFTPSRPDIRSPFAQLLATHESRQIFMENYPLMFKGYQDANPEKGWYFNRRKDTLCVDSGLYGLRILLQTCPDDFKKVTHLDVNPWSDNRWYDSTDDHSVWPRIAKSDVPLRDIPLELITIRHFPIHRKLWTQFKETTLILKKILQHEHSAGCERGRCTRLAIRIDHDNNEYGNEEGWGRHTFCKIHDEGKLDSHTCVDFELYAYDFDPAGGPWNQWNAKGFDVHLPERISDGTLPAGTREIDLHKYTANDGEVLPIRSECTPDLS